MHKVNSWLMLAAMTGAGGCMGAELESSLQSNLTGAIFTSDVNGTQVNQNIYVIKEAVYLDGGPGPNASPNAAALPAGDYFFQVTNPGGNVLLSTDHISCRRFRVSAGGVIDTVYSGTNYTFNGMAWVAGGCQHVEGTDQDSPVFPVAKTVQLYPYNNTPNDGGEYKVWVTRVEDYDGNAAYVPGPTSTDQFGPTGGRFGFVNSDSKTDHFKVLTSFEQGACGDGDLNLGEECDDGDREDGDGCSSICKVETPMNNCGNGDRNAEEECDDGNTSNGDGCSAYCQLEICGDGDLDPGESCDDGNTVSGDGCSATCRKEFCGNGWKDPGEECEDGNTTSGDGCSATCEVEGPPPPCCGNSIVETGETCDDGNTTSGDGCSTSCLTEVEPPPVPCCGDGHVDAGETCDDGNTTSGDGCSATCQHEPPPPPPVCGNHEVEGTEQCDDGNTTNGDGCSATCQTECEQPCSTCGCDGLSLDLDLGGLLESLL